jgi:hypothetical protein
MRTVRVLCNVAGSYFHSAESAVNARRTLFFSAPLYGDPVVYITGTMHEGDAFSVTCSEEANDIQVHQADLVQVERDVRPSGFYLRFQFFYMLPPHAADQPYGRPLFIRIFLNP